MNHDYLLEEPYHRQAKAEAVAEGCAAANLEFLGTMTVEEAHCFASSTSEAIIEAYASLNEVMPFSRLAAILKEFGLDCELRAIADTLNK